MAAEKLTISFPPDLLEELETALKEDGRGKSQTFQKWARDYLERRKIEERMAEAVRGDATLVPHGDLDEWMNSRRTRG